MNQPSGTPAVLRALHPGPLRSEQPLDPRGCRIGRDRARVDIVLHGIGVSRCHCWLGADEDGRWLIRDLESLNGIYVNGRAVEGEHFLVNGDVIGLGRRRAGDYQFCLQTGADGGREIRLTGSGPWLVGRETGLDVSLPADPVVSRRHARLTRHGASLLIDDLGSRNGTWVDGHRRRRARLHNDSRILIGGSEIQLTADSAAEGACLRVATVQQAIGVRVAERSPDGNGTTQVWRLPAGGLSALVGTPTPAAVLAELAGHQPGDGISVTFSEAELDHDLFRRRERIGRVECPTPGPERRRVGDILDDHAVLHLAGDLEAGRRRELVDATLGMLDIVHLKDWRHDRLSPLQRRLVRIAVELLHRPGLLLLDDPSRDLNAAECRFMVERLRAIAGAHMSILIIAERLPAGMRADERIAPEPATAPEPVATPPVDPPPRAPSLTATTALLRRRLVALLHRPAAAAEALLLPLVLTPALWFILPPGLTDAAAIAAVVCSAALFAASETCRCHAALVAPVRRHLLLSDSLGAAALLVLAVAAAQLVIVIAWTRFLPEPPDLAALSISGMLAAASAASVGLLVALASAGRIVPALALVVAVLLAQLIVADRVFMTTEPGFILERLGDSTAVVPAHGLMEGIGPETPRRFQLQPAAILLGQVVLWLALARRCLGRELSLWTRRRRDQVST